MNAKQTISESGWFLSPGTTDGDRVVTWIVCGPSGKMIAECESKTIAAHIVKLHNRTRANK